MTHNYLEIERYFQKFHDEEAAEFSYLSFGADKPFGCETWEELLNNHKRVVILAEAGSGKTAEMYEESLRRIDSGEFGFYATVNALCTQSVRDALITPEEQRRYDAWFASEKEGIFFVDSVDEARLQGHNFIDALSSLAKSLDGVLSRCTIILSCRVSDWRDVQDVSDFSALLCQIPKPEIDTTDEDTELDTDSLLAPIFKSSNNDDDDENEKPADYSPHAVVIAPLSRSQAADLAEWRGVQDTDEFIRQVIHADAEDLANRPQDLIALADLWYQERKVGSKQETLAWSINFRLTETNLDRAEDDDLSLEDAKHGAKLIAAALTLGKRRFLAIPGQSGLVAVDDQSINPQDVLPDWSSKKIRQLLTRSIFDPAMLGRVRFHNISVQQFLCARWLLDQIESGCPIRRIWDLVYDVRYGEEVLRPALKPVTAWLGQLHPAFTKRLMGVSPETLVAYGDPSCLSIHDRQRLLRHFIALYGGRHDAGISIDIQQVSRLADPELASEIKALWIKSGSSQECQEFLIRIIWIGQLDECLDIAEQAAKSKKHDYVRAIALKALSEMAPDKMRKEIAAYTAKNAASMSSRLIGEAVQVSLPNHMTAKQLSEVLRKNPKVPKRSVMSGLQYGLIEAFQSAKANDPLPLIRVMLRFLQMEPHVEKFAGEFSQDYGYLAGPVFELIHHMIDDVSNQEIDKNVIEILDICGLAADYGHDYLNGEALKRLQPSLQRNRVVNRQLFWFSAQRAKRDNPEINSYFHIQHMGMLWDITIADFSLFLSDYRQMSDPQDKMIALTTLMVIWRRNGENPALLQQVRDASLNDPEGQKEIEEWLNPSQQTDPEESEWRKRHRRIEHARQVQEDKDKLSWIKFRDRLVADSSHLSEDTGISDLCVLARWLRRTHSRSRYSFRDWQILATPYSNRVAKDARDGFVSYWRKSDPGFLSQGRGTTTNGSLMALIGLDIDAAESDGWEKSLSDHDVEVATAHALLEINGFPEWAQKLWTHRKDLAKGLLSREILWELNRRPKNEHGLHYIISTLAYCEGELRSLAAECVLEMLTLKEPQNDHTFSQAIRAIVGAREDHKSTLGTLAKKRTKRARTTGRKLTWLAIWIGCDADRAMPYLSRWLNRAKGSKKGKLFIELLSRLFDHNQPRLGLQYCSFATVEHLKELTLLAYRHVRREDDNVHEESYTPDARDDAESARGALLGMLLECPGEDTYKAILELSDLPEFSTLKERFQVLARERAVKDSDLASWSIEKVLSFAAANEAEPQTVADLHKVLLDRLIDIEDDILAGDFTDVTFVRQDDKKRADERVVQLEFANQLHLRSKSLYSVEREIEQPDFNEPDIRAKRPGLPSGIPVEVKVGDSWTFSELKEAVTNQLIGKYMQSGYSTHGILVVTYHGKKHRWKIRDGAPLVEFREMIAALQEFSDEHIKSKCGDKVVSVVPIYLWE